jgi:hypothetical protein
MGNSAPAATLPLDYGTNDVSGIRPERPRELPMHEKPSMTLPATVERIIRSPHPSIPEKAQIAVEGADHLYRELRVNNTLTDENGETVRLKPGAEVEVTIEAEPEATTSV